MLEDLVAVVRLVNGELVPLLGVNDSERPRGALFLAAQGLTEGLGGLTSHNQHEVLASELTAARREGVLPAGGGGLFLGEAVAAVGGPVLPGLEGDLARGAAACTNRVVHLAG